MYRSFQDVDAFREEIERMRARVRATEGAAAVMERRRGQEGKIIVGESGDEVMMQRAIELAVLSVVTRLQPNPCVGCIVTRGERIVGRGLASQVGAAHAEPLALQAAGAEAKGADVCHA